MKKSVASGVALGAVAAMGAWWSIRRAQARQRRQTVWAEFSPNISHRLHDEAVEKIAAQLRAHPPRMPVSIRKPVVSHQVPRGDYKAGTAPIDIAGLDRILEIDPVARTCTAGSGVTFVDVVAATLKRGLLPMTVPEMKTITLGGAVSGGSLESASFRFGGFHDSCLEYQVVTANGEVLTLTPDSLLFQMMQHSFGTLGVLTRLKFRLMEAKPFVKMRYQSYATLEGYLEAIAQITLRRGDVDFMDGIIHGPNRYVLCLGTMVDSAPYTHNYDWLTAFWETTGTRDEDYLKTDDYLFRYDRGVTNVVPLLASDTFLQVARRFERFMWSETPTVTLDVFLPFSRVREFMRWYQKTFDYFPLWCVPFRVQRKYEWFAEGYQTDDLLYLDLAIYGMKQQKGVNAHRLIEEKLLELGGFKTLISHNYMDEQEFWRMFNRGNYQHAKRMIDPAGVFRDLWAKTCRAAMTPPKPLMPVFAR